MPRKRPRKRPTKAIKKSAGGRRAPAAPTGFKQLRLALDRELRARFPTVRKVNAYGMGGWQIPLGTHEKDWEGTIDPNFVHIFLAERKQGTTLHYWNPTNPGGLNARRKALEQAGFKVMVGCIQFNRRKEFPIEAVMPLLDDAARALTNAR